MRRLAKESQLDEKADEDRAADKVQEAAEKELHEAEDSMGDVLVAEVRAENEMHDESAPAPHIADPIMTFGSGLGRRLRTKERWRHQQQLLQLQQLQNAARGSDVGKLPPLVPGCANAVLCVSPEQRARARKRDDALMRRRLKARQQLPEQPGTQPAPAVYRYVLGSFVDRHKARRVRRQYGAAHRQPQSH